ncbi:hypothetical protein D3C86_727710 [compost metagenome]
MAKNTIKTEEIKQLLSSKKKGDLRKVVKVIANNGLSDFNSDLFQILDNYISDEKMWELNYDIIRVLGKTGYDKVVPILENICARNEEHDMITSAASMALCRIRRTDLNDVKEVQRLLGIGKFAVVDGALRSMGIDKVIPTEANINTIIDSINAFEPKIEVGYADVREGLAVAAAGWPKNDIVKMFLEGCINSGDSALAKLAKSSINKKYSDIDY